MLSIQLIAALADNRVIGKDGQIPWHLSEDLKHFNQVTMGCPVLMGRSTYESIGKPLPGRRNIVLSSTISASDASGIEVVRSISEAKELLNNTGILMVIGGAGVYRACLPEADTLHLTIIHGDFEGDTFFPDWSHLPFKKTATESFFSDSLKLGYEFETWKKSV